MFENVRADLRRSIANRKDGTWKQHQIIKTAKALGNLGVWPILAYRFGHWARSVRVPVLGISVRLLAFVARQAAMIWTGVFIHPAADIGPGLVIHTWFGVFVGTTNIGKNCTLGSGVLISHATRSIGDNVYFGAGAKVIGDTKIGNNVVVMPNSLVMVDVRDDTTIAGVPARIKLRGGRPQRFEAQKIPVNGSTGKPVTAPSPEPLKAVLPGSNPAERATSTPDGSVGAVGPRAPALKIR
jgi:serine O-acetyltransferase